MERVAVVEWPIKMTQYINKAFVFTRFIPRISNSFYRLNYCYRAKSSVKSIRWKTSQTHTSQGHDLTRGVSKIWLWSLPVAVGVGYSVYVAEPWDAARRRKIRVGVEGIGRFFRYFFGMKNCYFGYAWNTFVCATFLSFWQFFYRIFCYIFYFPVFILCL